MNRSTTILGSIAAVATAGALFFSGAVSANSPGDHTHDSSTAVQTAQPKAQHAFGAGTTAMSGYVPITPGRIR